MREARCSRCGAVFPVAHDGAVCPYCGAEPRSKIAGALAFVGRRWIIVAILLLALVFARPSREAWMWIGLISIIAALALGWFFLSRARRKSTDEIANLHLGLDPQSPRTGESQSVALSPPKVPDRWRALVDSRPPRDVYLPSKVWKGFVVETFYVVLILYFAFLSGKKHHVSPLEFFYSHPDVGDSALLLTYFASIGARLKGFLTTRHIMRDGEVTIAYTMNRSFFNRATYRFWTKTGAVFERRTRVIKRPDFATDFGLVPVFYMPQDPRESVALYATEFSVRLPESAAVPLQKVALKG
jgi:hypothetical protein